MGSNSFSKLAQSWPPCSHEHSLQGHFHTPSFMASTCISELLDLQLQVHLLTRSIAASKHISTLAQLLPLGASPMSLDHYLHVHMTMATNCISTLAGLGPASAYFSSTGSWPLNGSPNSLHYGFQVHLQVHALTASQCISTFTQLASPGPPPISLKYCLQPDWLYFYIS